MFSCWKNLHICQVPDPLGWEQLPPNSCAAWDPGCLLEIQQKEIGIPDSQDMLQQQQQQQQQQRQQQETRRNNSSSVFWGCKKQWKPTCHSLSPAPHNRCSCWTISAKGIDLQLWKKRGHKHGSEYLPFITILGELYQICSKLRKESNE